MSVSSTEASYSPGSPELTLIRKFGPPTDTSNSSSSNSSSSSKKPGKSKSKGDKSVGMMGHEAGNSSSSGNNTTSSSEFKSVLGCGGKKDYRRSVVDLTWRRGKVGDKITREYQRF